MTAKPTSDPSPCLEHAPLPMATVEGATHIVRYVNPAFCRLMDKAGHEIVGRPFRELLPGKDECLTLLDRVYRTGKSASHTEREGSDPVSAFSSCTMWPVMEDERTVGVVIQMIERAPLHDSTRAMNEALMLGSVRQHELTEAAVILTNEISHRIKNSLQVVMSLIASEARRAPAPCAEGYRAMQARIGAIAKLYDLISRSSLDQTVPVDAYLSAIAESMSASLLGSASGISIEVKAEALHIDQNHAVSFGLLINELGTNAIKHAFPGGTGRVMLSVRQVGDELELTVADDGVGMKPVDAARAPGKHGSDYVAIFVRQLGGTIAESGPGATGTIFTVRFPLLADSQGAYGA